MDFFTIFLYCSLIGLILSLVPLILMPRRGRGGGGGCYWNLPPGPIKLPIIGNLHQLGHLPHRSLHKLSLKHGPLMYIKLGAVPTVVASSAGTAKEFLRTHDLESCSRPFVTSLEKLSYGFSDIAFTPYGDQWRELRKICYLHLFSAKKVASFQGVREEEAERMVSLISSRCGSQVNLTMELLVLASNITCRSAFGKRYYTGAGDAGRLYEILSETEAMFVGLFIADFIPMLGWLDTLTGMRGRLEKHFRNLDDFYQKVIDDHLDPTWQDDRSGVDVVDILIDMQKKAAHITDGHIKGILMNMFIAGSDTSSAAIEWTMAELMRSPRTMKKAQEEVRRVVGKKGKIDEGDLDQLAYLKSVFKEAMRLHPPGPLICLRETISHCQVNGYDVPERTRLLINAWAIGRDEDVWERPDEFYPERFVNSSIDVVGQDFELIPFGGGRRICPGMQFGILVVQLALANLLYHFDWELPEGMSNEDMDMSETPGDTVHRKPTLYLVPRKYP